MQVSVTASEDLAGNQPVQTAFHSAEGAWLKCQSCKLPLNTYFSPASALGGSGMLSFSCAVVDSVWSTRALTASFQSG